MDISVVLAWLGLLATLIGIPAAYIFARRGRQRPDLRGAYDFDVIIKSEDGILDRLKMDFDGRDIKSVSRTRLALWNARGDTVIGTDIVPADALRLQLDADDLALHPRIVAMSREQIGVSCAINQTDPTVVDIAFDFLDSSDGFIIELLHVKPEAARLEGTIRGAPLPRSFDKASMSPEDLEAVTAKWFLRVKHLPWRSRFAAGIAILMVFAYLPFMAYITFDDLVPHRQMVDASAFDLNNLDGQRDFSEAVREAKNVDVANRWTLGVPALVLMALSGFFVFRVAVYRPLKPVIPRSIVQSQPE